MQLIPEKFLIFVKRLLPRWANGIPDSECIAIFKLLESLSYKSIINRGYSVIKNSKEKVLKSKKDILSDKKLIIETKFGILQSDLSTEKNE